MKTNPYNILSGFCLAILMFFAVHQAFTQENTQQTKSRLEIGAGLNFAYIKQIAKSFDLKPLISVQYQSKPVFYDFSFRGGIDFTFLNVDDDKSLSHQYYYMKPELLLQFPIGKENIFMAGLQESIIVGKKQYDDVGSTDEQYDLKSTTDFLVGFMTRFHQKYAVGIVASASLTDPDHSTRCVKLLVTYDLFNSRQK